MAQLFLQVASGLCLEAESALGRAIDRWALQHVAQKAGAGRLEQQGGYLRELLTNDASIALVVIGIRTEHGEVGIEQRIECRVGICVPVSGEHSANHEADVRLRQGRGSQALARQRRTASLVVAPSGLVDGVVEPRGESQTGVRMLLIEQVKNLRQMCGVVEAAMGLPVACDQIFPDRICRIMQS